MPQALCFLQERVFFSFEASCPSLHPRTLDLAGIHEEMLNAALPMLKNLAQDFLKMQATHLEAGLDNCSWLSRAKY